MMMPDTGFLATGHSLISVALEPMEANVWLNNKLQSPLCPSVSNFVSRFACKQIILLHPYMTAAQ